MKSIKNILVRYQTLKKYHKSQSKKVEEEDLQNFYTKKNKLKVIWRVKKSPMIFKTVLLRKIKGKIAEK